MRAITTTTEPAAMSSIYRASPSKRTKASAGGGSAHSAGGGGSSGVWTLVGQERESASATGNTDWPCPRKGCYGFLVARTRKNSISQYAVCDTSRSDDPSTCQAFYNLNKNHWGSADNPRVCDWCDADTCDSPSIGVLNEGAESSTKPWSNYHTVMKLCLGARSLNKLKFAWVVTEGSPVIGKPCEAVAEGLQVGDNINTKCTGDIKVGDLLLKKAGDYLLEIPPAFHYHCAKRAFDIEILKIVDQKQERKVLGTSAEEETKQACATIPADLGDEF